MRLITCLVGVTFLGSVMLALADAPASVPATYPELGGACGGSVQWSEFRYAAEDYLRSGDGLLVSDFADPTLQAVVDQWHWAMRRRDIGTLLRLTIDLSDEHLEVERRHLEASVEDGPDVLHHYPYYLIMDDTNRAHVWVYTAVVLVIDGQCIECGMITEWVRLDGRWYTLSEKQPFHSAARKAHRPNEGYVDRRFEHSSDDAAELLEAIDAETNELPE